MLQNSDSLSVPIVVSVATMNVGNGLAPDNQLLKVIRDARPDIVALEELNRKQAASIAPELRDSWPHQFTFSDGYAGRGIFSKHPFRRQEELVISEGRPDGMVEVELDGQILSIFVAHPRPPKFRGASLGMPFASSRQLLRLADMTMDASPAVLLGDFNMRPDKTMYAKVRDRGLLDAFAESGEGTERTFPVRVGKTMPVRGTPMRVRTPRLFRLDYIWHTPDIRSVATWVGKDTGSDHLPLISRLAIPRDVPADSE